MFAARRGPFSSARPAPSRWRDAPEFVSVLAERGNDLTDAAISLQPAIAEVLGFLRRAREARYIAMSGSGATCFALFDTMATARRAAASVPAKWWRYAGVFVAPPT